MITVATIALVCIWIIVTIGFSILSYCELRKQKNSTMSIKESMDLVNLPVVTFENNGNKYNFIIDTGANDSIINESCENILVTPHKSKNIVQGIIGDNKKCHTVTIEFSYKNMTFETMFNVVDLKALFDTIKEDYGVTIHGILGTNFLDKYNYIIDFKDYVIYRKK